ncbi:MAG: RNA polymerase subunit sigma-70 [Thermoleophilia bacterium]|nr:RNA polymerase subunit sigma-70 [Thermoleophilia bacterium]MDH4339285.1 RNA polymerase subunit sigma-70 [Thermoleophilia bacterium]MDH5280608.1 RNA polymerase subunit sigma-70 [Thermoleophilia bacterium]
MTTGAAIWADEAALLSAARGGDGQAFERLLEPHRRALHVHCYRLLGSLHDADDALQETLLRAWRGLERYESRASLRAWLYRIATNVCFRAIERRARTPEALDPAEVEIAKYLQPYPDRLLETDIEVEERESVGLAFVSVMQLLPPRQRAVIVLREALGWSAKEVADLLGDNVASVNSALQRARGTLHRERTAGRLARDHAPASAEAEARVMKKFVAAWEAVDVDGIVELLVEDAVLTMPPEPMRLTGTKAIGDFFRTVPAAGALERIRLVPTRANCQPAVAAYLEDDAGAYQAYGVMVFALEGEAVASVTGFAGHTDLFPALGLPVSLDG